MSTDSVGWRDRVDAVDAALIDGYQSGLPVRERPFAAVAEDVGTSETAVVERIEDLLAVDVLRRVGPVLNPPVIGSSTLAAMQVPEERFDAVAAVVNEYPQVNHNYERDHQWNMWFVVTAGTRERRDEILAEIEDRTGCAVLNLPMLTDYYIDLEFPVVNEDRFARESLAETDVEAREISEDATAALGELDRRVLIELQDGFPLSTTPYREVADALDASVEDVIAAVDRLVERRCIKRIGCVVNHVTTGFDANCMVVWDVPDEDLDERGRAVGRLPYVTLCYHRPRRPELGWPYNLFTMVHGRDAEAVAAKVDELGADYLPVDHERLFSTATLKQTGARYEALTRPTGSADGADRDS